jgi:predicted nucleic acid-binding protein
VRKRYLLDANHLGPALAPVSRIRERIYQVCRTGIPVGTCTPVLCELEVGIQQLDRPEACLRELRSLLKKVRLWPIDQEVARLYGEVFHEVRKRGRVLSQVDMMLAALARSMKLTLLTADRDFEALPDLRTENWLV